MLLSVCGQARAQQPSDIPGYGAEPAEQITGTALRSVSDPAADGAAAAAQYAPAAAAQYAPAAASQYAPEPLPGPDPAADEPAAASQYAPEPGPAIGQDPIPPTEPDPGAEPAPGPAAGEPEPAPEPVSEPGPAPAPILPEPAPGSDSKPESATNEPPSGSEPPAASDQAASGPVPTPTPISDPEPAPEIEPTSGPAAEGSAAGGPDLAVDPVPEPDAASEPVTDEPAPPPPPETGYPPAPVPASASEPSRGAVPGAAASRTAASEPDPVAADRSIAGSGVGLPAAAAPESPAAGLAWSARTAAGVPCLCPDPSGSPTGGGGGVLGDLPYSDAGRPDLPADGVGYPMDEQAAHDDLPPPTLGAGNGGAHGAPAPVAPAYAPAEEKPPGAVDGSSDPHAGRVARPAGSGADPPPDDGHLGPAGSDGAGGLPSRERLPFPPPTAPPAAPPASVHASGSGSAGGGGDLQPVYAVLTSFCFRPQSGEYRWFPRGFAEPGSFLLLIPERPG